MQLCIDLRGNGWWQDGTTPTPGKKQRTKHASTDVFVHAKFGLKSSGLTSLTKGDEVEFMIAQRDARAVAVDVQVVKADVASAVLSGAGGAAANMEQTLGPEAVQEQLAWPIVPDALGGHQFSCDLCKTGLMTESQALQHSRGRKHAKKLKEKHIEATGRSTGKTKMVPSASVADGAVVDTVVTSTAGPGSMSRRMYRTVATCQLRADFAMDSAKLKTIAKGEFIEALEERTLTRSAGELCRVRVRTSGGWLSKTSATSGTVLLEPAGLAEETKRCAADTPIVAQKKQKRPTIAVFTDAGSLGITFRSETKASPPAIKAILKGGLAAHQPQLAEGMVLVAVQGTPVGSRGPAAAVALIKAAARPLTLAFESAAGLEDKDQASRLLGCALQKSDFGATSLCSSLPALLPRPIALPYPSPPATVPEDRGSKAGRIRSPSRRRRSRSSDKDRGQGRDRRRSRSVDRHGRRDGRNGRHWSRARGRSRSREHGAHRRSRSRDQSRDRSRDRGRRRSSRGRSRGRDRSRGRRSRSRSRRRQRAGQEGGSSCDGCGESFGSNRPPNGGILCAFCRRDTPRRRRARGAGEGGGKATRAPAIKMEAAANAFEPGELIDLTEHAVRG